MRMAWLVLFVALLAGCGSGGGAGTGAGSGAEPAPVATSAAVEIATLSASATTVIYGVQFVLQLPAGVTVSADPVTGIVQPDALHIANSGALRAARYQPATPQSQGSVNVVIVDAGGFTAGPLATLACTFEPGLTVSPAGFSLDRFTAVNSNGTVMTGVAPPLHGPNAMSG